MSDHTENPLDNQDIVEIFAAGSAVEADRIVMLLSDNNLNSERRETSMPVIPGAGNARFLITVLSSQKEAAIALIQQAIDDEILPADGTFLS